MMCVLTRFIEGWHIGMLLITCVALTFRFHSSASNASDWKSNVTKTDTVSQPLNFRGKAIYE